MKARTARGFSNEKYDYRRLTPHDWGRVKAAYYGMITLIDDNIGRILQALEEKGIEVEPVRVDEYSGGRFTFFKDPDGLPLELHE